MAPSEEPAGNSDRLKRALQTHSIETVRFLVLAKEELDDSAYSNLVKTVQEIVKRSANPDGGITIEKCQQILSEVFVGRTRLLNSFHHFLQACDPFHDELPLDPVSFLSKLKACPHISDEDYNDLLTTMYQFSTTRTMTVEHVYEKVKRIMRHCPEYIEIFQTFLPPRHRGLPIEQPCGSPKPSPMGKAVPSFTPDAANYNLDVNPIRTKAANISNKVAQLENLHGQNHDGREYPFRLKHSQWMPNPVKISTTKGNGEPLLMEEYEGDKIDPLPDWSPSRENELPPKVDLKICTPCTPSYCQLTDDCSTLQSSYRTELGRSIFNDTMVSVASGTEDCFKFRTKNQYEENIIKCEDDMFESDMLLQRFRATAGFIGKLQDRVDIDMKIEEHLTPLHRRCIEQLYDDYGLDMLDSLSETQNTSAALAILQSRSNQKIEVLSAARLSLHKACSSIIANNYNRSLDYRSASFKQLDAKRMAPKALLAEAKEINMKRSITGVKHLSSPCNNQYRLVSDDARHSTDLHVYEDIDSIVSYAYNKKISSEHKAVMIWRKLVQSFVSANCQLPILNCTVAPKEACERCGLSKKFLRSIINTSLAKNFPLSSKTGECLGNASNKSSSMHDSSKVEIEEGEFVPCTENIQMGTMLEHVNGAVSYDVVAPVLDGSSFQYPEPSICDKNNKVEVQHESREGFSVELGTLAYSELRDLKGAKTCCSLVVLCRLHQMMYERLLVAKVLSKEASAKALLRGSRTSDLYAKFKGKLLKLINGSTDNSNFEEYCLNYLGPKSYVLFTLDKLIWQVINQLRGVCDDRHDKMRRPSLSEDLLHHHNARGSPVRPSNGLVEEDPEGGEGTKLHEDIVKPTQNHFHGRKKRKLENSPATISQPSVDKSKS